MMKIESNNNMAFASIADWCQISGMGRTSTYHAINRGDLLARKLGGKTLIDVPRGLAWLNSLPLANIRLKGSAPNRLAT